MSYFEQRSPEFEAIKDDNETILWSGKPTFIPFVAQGIPFLIIGLVWGAMSSVFYMNMFEGGLHGMQSFILLFMVFHLFPFWGSILNIVRLVLIYPNVHYAITTKRVMVRRGFFGIDFKTIDFDKIKNMEVNVNPLEKLLNVGTIKVFSGETMSSEHGTRSLYDVFKAIENPYGVFKELKQISLDIRSDLNYPNQLRPQNNPGYTTKYRG